jgi:hypothetical protein
MTVAVGLDRLPRPITRLLGEAAGNLITVSKYLDERLAGDAAALGATVRAERRDTGHPARAWADEPRSPRGPCATSSLDSTPRFHDDCR